MRTLASRVALHEAALSSCWAMLVLGLAAAAAAADSGPGPAAAPPVAFVGVDVATMTSDALLSGQTVLVRDGLIEAIGPAGDVAVPPDALRVEGAGRYLMPGLADLHTHLGIEQADGSDDGANQALVYLAHGVTTLLNMGDTLVPRGDGLMELRDRIRRGELPGPEILTASIAYGPGDGVAAHHTVESYEDGRRHVRDSREAGYDVIKVYNRVPAAAFDGIADQAREEGLAVVGHIPRALGLAESLARGLDAVAHANQLWCGYFECSIMPSRVRGAVSLLRTRGTAVVTTLYLNETFTAVYCGDSAALQRFMAQPEIRYVHPLVVESWRAQASGFGSQGCRPGDADASYRFIQDFTREFYEAGIPLVLGTDSPPAMGVPGHSLLEELRVVSTSLRIGPYRALLLATRDAGDFVARLVPDAEAFGTVEVGRRADLLLLEGDPLASLANLRRRVGVMARGRWFTEAQLQENLAEVAAGYAGAAPTPAPSVSSPG